PVSVHQCQLPVPHHSASSSVPPISVHQCSLSVPITAASLAHISEGEKSLIYKILQQKRRNFFSFFFQNFQCFFV
ncbi:unnamed protein product, partial [Staurois parvus]